MAKNWEACFARQLALDRSDWNLRAPVPSPPYVRERYNLIAQIWSRRIRTFACRYQKPMPYHLAILHTVVTWGARRGKRKAGLEERAVQGRRDTASKPGYPLSSLCSGISGDFYCRGKERNRLSRARTYNITVMSGTFQPIKL